MDMRRIWILAIALLALPLVIGGRRAPGAGPAEAAGRADDRQGGRQPRPGDLQPHDARGRREARLHDVPSRRPFSILGSKGGTRAIMKHENFEKGQQCGTCHNGKKALRHGGRLHELPSALGGPRRLSGDSGTDGP